MSRSNQCNMFTIQRISVARDDERLKFRLSYCADLLSTSTQSTWRVMRSSGMPISLGLANLLSSVTTSGAKGLDYHHLYLKCKGCGSGARHYARSSVTTSKVYKSLLQNLSVPKQSSQSEPCKVSVVAVVAMSSTLPPIIAWDYRKCSVRRTPI